MSISEHVYFKRLSVMFKKLLNFYFSYPKGLNANMEISGTENQRGVEIINGKLKILGNVRIAGNINNSNTSLSRNSLCPCGSGDRYKHCCGKINVMN